MRRWVGPASAVAVAIAGIIGLTLSDAPPRDTNAGPDPEPIEISSDADRFATLPELVAASDLVVRARVVSTDRGRTFGEPGATAIESRLVALEIDDVLHAEELLGPQPTVGSAITVEEPGWLDDGTPLIVDGVPPTETGDELIWFLDAVPSLALDSAEDAAAYVLVGPQGHYRIERGRLVAASGADPLMETLAALGRDSLAVAIRAVDPAPVTAPAG